MAITTLEAVVPVRLSGDKEQHAAARFGMLLDSLSRRWSDPAPLRLSVIGMPGELPALRAVAGTRPNLDLAFVDERDVLGDLRALALGGWFKQSLIKLLFAQVCQADAYLYLDNDVICVRPLSRSDLLKDGRVVTGWEPKNVHPGWWDGARKMLGRAASDRKSGLGVTPNILIRAVAAAVPEAVGRASGLDPMDALLAGTGDASTCWVENTLYTELAEMTGDLDRWHTPPDNCSPYRSAGDLWTPGQLPDWDPVAALAAAPQVRFVVAQSNLGLDPGYVRERLASVIA